MPFIKRQKNFNFLKFHPVDGHSVQMHFLSFFFFLSPCIVIKLLKMTLDLEKC